MNWRQQTQISCMCMNTYINEQLVEDITVNSGGSKDISLGEATIYKKKKRIKGGLAVSNFYFKISKNTGGFKRISRPCGGGFPHNTILGAASVNNLNGTRYHSIVCRTRSEAHQRNPKCRRGPKPKPKSTWPDPHVHQSTVINSVEFPHVNTSQTTVQLIFLGDPIARFGQKILLFYCDHLIVFVAIDWQQLCY